MSDLSSFRREATALLQESPINRSSVADFLNRFSGNVDLLSDSRITAQDVLSNIPEVEIRWMLEEGITVDRGDMKSLVPVWSLLGTKFKNQAELIENAWMGLSKDMKFKDTQDLRSYYYNIDGELARKNMLQLADLRIQQKRKCSAEDNAVQEAQETEEENEMESLTPVISVKTDLTKQPKLNLPNRENVSSPTEQKFREESLVSAFTIDCPRDLTNISYRMLHRLELNYCNSPVEGSNNFSQSEEDFWPKIEQITREQKFDVSNLLSMYSVTDKVNILRLLLESRFAIPICSKDTIELLRITQRLEEDIFLGEDLKLPRIAIISQVSFDSSAGKIMEDLFNLKTSLKTDETSSMEVGQGLVCFEKGYKKSCIVIHISGDFKPYWKFLTEFTDYLIVEDEFISKSNKVSHFMGVYSPEKILPQFITIWIPSFQSARSNHRPFYLIEGSIDYFSGIQRNQQLKVVFREVGLHASSLYSVFPAIPCSLSPDINNLRQMYMDVSNMDGLEGYRSNVLILQKSFAREGELREKLNEFELVNDTGSRLAIQEKISNEEKFRFSNSKKNDPLLNIFLKGLQKNDIDHILLYLRVIDDAISLNIKESKLVRQLEEAVNQKLMDFLKSLQLSGGGPEYQNQKESYRKDFLAAKEKRNYALLSLRHLWREVSLFYSSGKCADLEYLPHLAASCLIAGETLELYDGDANMLNVDWIGAIFKNLSSLLPNKRIFVLSVLGEQSSGKSTLLNTMFGICLAASIGQCTRGLTMTLVKTVNRKEYDYVVILDTEGVRSPEHKGIHGCAKRDNKIATLSILPSDAVILVIKGENDNALKEILPIVALAYKGSKLAEERGGLLSCKIFAAYNQVKCHQENRSKLLNIFIQLSTTLVESFTKANSLEDLDMHTSISFPKMFSNEQDIRVFGYNTKGDPPNDIPNKEFSLQIIDFREYIHEQVVSQAGWSARKIESLDNYLFLVWECLNNSNFDLSLETVIERHVYSEIERIYRTLRKLYILKYEEQYDLLKDIYKKAIPSETEELTTLRKIDKAVEDLDVKMKPHAEKFEEEVNRIFEQKENQKWKTEYTRKVEDIISRQTGQWRDKLAVFLKNQLLFDVKVGQYEKEMRDKIIEEFKMQSLKHKSKQELITMFDSNFNNILQKAKKENPPMDVRNAVLKAYMINHTIKALGVDLLLHEETNIMQNKPLWKRLWEGVITKPIENICDDIVKFVTQSKSNEERIEKDVTHKIVSIITGKKYYSDASVHEVISEVEKYLTRLNKKIVKDKKKKIHRFACEILVEVMRSFCLDVASGLDEVDLMASRLEDYFSRHAFEAFNKELQESVIGNLRKKCWPQHAKNIQGHMDLFLIEEVEPKGIAEVLRKIENPSLLKRLTTCRLISFEIEALSENLNWAKFQDQLERCLRNTYQVAPKDEKTGLKSFQFHQLLKSQKELFKSTYIADELTKEMNTFGWTELDKLSVNFDQRHIDAMINKISQSYRTLDKNHIIDNVLIQLQDNIHFEAAFCTPCQEPCPLCESPCFLEVSHNGPHDTFHQPKGLVGMRYVEGKKLSADACNTTPLDHHFRLHDGDGSWKYADFSKKFTNWMQPDRTKPVSDYREYLIRSYNKQIAAYYSVNPSDTSVNAESLEVVIDKIKRKVDFRKDFPGKP
ncbi:hypothetical protein QYM36_013169 [Artemia franciscana]|uniref:VLIG-type G domain-containing protein n=1 Tax=Artemia franciscana TaxID=6661 RepID=A0AA88HPG7_ARTSF|nr:hypothetical protein QYM36_013169 [Artemia franciscana]